MAVIEIAKIKVRRGQENRTGMPQLDSGEFGWAEDTEHLYIGKRIVDGAADDLNTRILTENDLNNIFALIHGGQAVATTSTYKYRDTAEFINSQVSTVGIKLDNSVSLTDYGLIVSSTATDITDIIQDAVQDLFANQLPPDGWHDWRTADARSPLIVPAGNYYISDAVHLPPYTTLIGQGAGMTKLTFVTATDRPMFKTVDAEDNEFESANMLSGAPQARNVYIADMTLEYSDVLQTTFPLLSLDNVLDARVERVHFQTAFDSTSTTTYGLTAYGKGIEIRGTGGGIGSGDVNLCQNIDVVDCVFNGLYTGIEGTGTVIRPFISNSIFSNLNRGIKFYTVDTKPGPSNGVISKSRFENIVAEAIYVGENPNGIPTDHLSEDNFFIQVGNGVGFDDFTTSNLNTTPVITFMSVGNKSRNDYFHRFTVATTTTDAAFYFNPLVSGRVSIDNSAAFTTTAVASSITPVTKLPITGASQTVNLRYQLSNSGLSRAGTLLVNVSAEGYTAVTDTYNYSEGMYTVVSNVTTATIAGLTTTTQFAVDTAIYPEFADPTLTNGTWFLTGSDVYAGYAAAIVDVFGVQGSKKVFDTDSSSPQFNFTTPGETWSLLKSDSPNVQFQIDSTNIVKNYVSVVCDTGSSVSDLFLEYQVNILS
jgi:hypothetical protein